ITWFRKATERRIGEAHGGRRRKVAMTAVSSAAESVSSGHSKSRMNIIDKTDEEIWAVADPLWRDLLEHSNEGEYGEFVKHFARSLALAMNQVVVSHQFANSEL